MQIAATNTQNGTLPSPASSGKSTFTEFQFQRGFVDVLLVFPNGMGLSRNLFRFFISDVGHPTFFRTSEEARGIICQGGGPAHRRGLIFFCRNIFPPFLLFCLAFQSGKYGIALSMPRMQAEAQPRI